METAGKFLILRCQGSSSSMEPFESGAGLAGLAGIPFSGCIRHSEGFHPCNPEKRFEIPDRHMDDKRNLYGRSGSDASGQCNEIIADLSGGVPLFDLV